MLRRVSRSREKSGFESSNASRVLVKELKKRQNELKELKESKSEISDLSIELDDAYVKDECRSPLLEALLCSDRSTSSLNYNKKSDRLALRETTASAVLKNHPMISPVSCFSFSSRNMAIPYDSSSEISSISHTYSQNQANVQSSYKQRKSDRDKSSHKGDAKHKSMNTNVIAHESALNQNHHHVDGRSVSIDDSVHHIKQKSSSRRNTKKKEKKSDPHSDDQVNTNMNEIDDGYSETSVAASQKTMQTSASMKDLTTTIVAPNVDKLSPNSVVEVLLRNKEELVSIHCSVDVLKMRSQFFYTVLSEQDLSHTLSSEMSTEDSERSRVHRLTSRIPIEINDDTPFECLAFLECLHDGRNVTSNGEWSYNWARLSVVWKVQDMISEYAQIVDNYLRNLLTKIEKESWRCNSNVFGGYQAVVFQKQAFSSPKFLHGTIVDMKDADPSYGVVHLQIDKSNIGKDQQHSPVAVMSMSTTTATATFPSPSPSGYAATGATSTQDSPNVIDTNDALPSPGAQSNVAVLGEYQASSSSHHTYSPQKYGVATSYSTTTETIYTEDYIPPATGPNNSVGGVENKQCNNMLVTIDTSLSSEYSLFVRKEGMNWIEPDVLNLAESGVTQLERSTFWEMVRSIIELPTLAQHCHGRVCNQDDITTVLKKPEFKVLWPNSVPNFLPKRCALELIEVAYANDSF